MAMMEQWRTVLSPSFLWLSRPSDGRRRPGSGAPTSECLLHNVHRAPACRSRRAHSILMPHRAATPTRGLRVGPRRGLRRRRGRLGGRAVHPAAAHPRRGGRRGPRPAAAGAEAARQDRRVQLPRHAGRARRAARRRRPGLRPVVSHPGGRGARAGRRDDVRRVARHPRRAHRRAGRSRGEEGAGPGRRAARRPGRGAARRARARPRPSWPGCSTATASRCGTRCTPRQRTRRCRGRTAGLPGRAQGDGAAPAAPARARRRAARHRRRGRAARRISRRSASGSATSARSRCRRMAPTGVACRLATVEDPLFGPVVSFGLGGMADRPARRPVLRRAAADRHRPGRDGPLGAGLPAAARARPASPGADLAALEDLLARVARLADDIPEVAALELNPVVAAPDGAACSAATGRLAPPAGPVPTRGARALPG